MIKTRNAMLKCPICDIKFNVCLITDGLDWQRKAEVNKDRIHKARYSHLIQYHNWKPQGTVFGEDDGLS